MGEGRILRVSGSVVVAGGLPEAGLHHRVAVGRAQLAGEIIRIQGEAATVQVYEHTEGLRVGDPVRDAGEPFSVLLGPGLLGSVFDGVQRPLGDLLRVHGPFLGRGASRSFAEDERRWEVRPLVTPGDRVLPGAVLAEVDETPGVVHRVLCPPGVAGVVAEVAEGQLAVRDVLCRLEEGGLVRLAQRWPCRTPRPHGGKHRPDAPSVTGQRVIDCFFPLAHGGFAVLPGGFGTGKTVLEHTLARHLDVDVVVYVGCGERGNEMTEILHDFQHLQDPRSGRPLLERTVLVVNTSNMPVAAREASIYTGVTIAEYYRDMGLRVALLADSISRWAEALREISSRLEEMPGEEGYPPYLASRLGQFYERAGRVVCLGAPEREGALSVVAAVSPPGGDLSEPVTQVSLRIAGCFWALDPALAAQRHYPAVAWEESFSLYREFLRDSWEQLGGEGWGECVARLGDLLAREEAIREIAQLVGYDALQDAERLVLAAGRAVREGFLRQDSFHPEDQHCAPAKARRLMDLFLARYDQASRRAAGAEGETLEPPDFGDLVRLRLLPLADLPAAVPAGGRP